MNNKVLIVILGIIVLFVILPLAKYYYFDIYLLSLNGQVENIRINMKESMLVTVSGTEHNISHSWPKFQMQVEVGDSVYKKPKDYNIILVKKKTAERIVCNYE